jgi:A/G-specific adenine glycosylase
MLLHRTRAGQAESVFLDLRARFPGAADLVAAGPEVAAEITSRTGLHWRGPLLFDTARRVSAAGGVPPEDPAQLRALPGVGPYASAAWLSLHRGKRAVIIDNNVARWLARLEGKPYDAETRRKRWVRGVAESLTPARKFRDYNYAVLDFTMRICVPGKPRCGECPIRSDCHFGTPSLRLASL